MTPLPYLDRTPAAIQAAKVVRDPVGGLTALQRRHGDAFAVKAAFYDRPVVYVADPQLATATFALDRAGALAGITRLMLRPVVGDQSVLILDGEPWRRHRRLLTPPFRGGAVRATAERITELTEEEIARWPMDTAFALRPRMQALTLEVILRVVFGIRDGERLDRLTAVLPRLLTALSRIIWMPPALRRAVTRVGARLTSRLDPVGLFLTIRDEVDTLLYAEIAERRKLDDTGRTDVLSLLVAARDEDDMPLSDAEVRDELLTLLEAGHETTATGLSWAFERLMRTPAVAERLRRAVDDEEDGYVNAVAQETLRIRPVVFDIGRVSTAPVDLADRVHVPANWMIAPSVTLIHRDPRWWPEPQVFRPERFIDRRPEPGTWIPFGGGQRYCLGAQLALVEMRVILREVTRRLHLRPVDPADELQRLQHVTLVPARGAMAVAERRTGLR
jgi:cytochrome P450